MSILQSLGVECGKALIPADRSNAAGFWEHSEVVAIYERLLARLERVWHGPKGPGRFAFAPEMRMTADTEGADSARLRLLDCWSGWATEQTDTLLEKCPPNLTKIAWLRKVFPDAKFIVMTRDPRAVAAATTKWAKTSIEELVFHWHVAHLAALEDEADDCLRLRYEDYCEDPAGHLAAIGDRFGLEPSSSTAPGDDRFKEYGTAMASIWPISRPGISGAGYGRNLAMQSDMPFARWDRQPSP